MNPRYLENLRKKSCYPTYRGFVEIVTVLGYLLAVLCVVAGTHNGRPMLFFIVAAVLALFVRVAKEVSLMIADIADATIDFCASQPHSLEMTSLLSDKVPRSTNEQRD